MNSISPSLFYFKASQLLFSFAFYLFSMDASWSILLHTKIQV